MRHKADTMTNMVNWNWHIMTRPFSDKVNNRDYQHCVLENLNQSALKGLYERAIMDQLVTLSFRGLESCLRLFCFIFTAPYPFQVILDQQLKSNITNLHFVNSDNYFFELHNSCEFPKMYFVLLSRMNGFNSLHDHYPENVQYGLGWVYSTPCNVEFTLEVSI